MTDSWTYRFTKQAGDELRMLDEDTARRIVEKLDEVMGSEFREPPD